jgi:uncharacterized coiled-coil protein SlyX
MSKKTILIIDSFDPTKQYPIHIRKQISKVLSKLEKDQRYELSELIQQYDGVITKEKNIKNTQDVFKQIMKVGKQIGVIKEVSDYSISFENFCELDTVAYMRQQLTQTKYKNESAKTKHTGGGTRRAYSLSIWKFHEWIIGKSITTQIAISLGDNLQRIEKKIIPLNGIEDFLRVYQESNNRGAEFERFIKSYLMDSEQHSNKSKGYMGNIMGGIKAYFSKNESPITINFNVNVAHDNTTEEPHISTMSIPELHELLTTGKPTITEKAIVLCKFHAGVDNSTFADRFNFESYMQIVKWFGSDKHDSWDLKKCPVIINLTRIKVGFPHISCLDQDAIMALQKALDWRYQKTGEPMKIGQALFLNTKLTPVTDRTISELIPKLAQKAGVQKKYNTLNGSKNEKTSHELRDLLKSTLIKNGVPAYASDHLIGHMPRDSYEKESILYPEKIREEFMKASKDINVFTGFSNYVKNGNADVEKVTREFKERIEKLEIDKMRITRGAKEVLGGTITQQNGMLLSMQNTMRDMAKEIKKLQKQNGTYVERKFTTTSKEYLCEESKE